MPRGQGPHLERTVRDGFQPMGVRGESVHNNAEHIRDTLERRLSPAHARLLAIPRRSDDGAITDWYAQMDGTVARWKDLSRVEKLETAKRVEALVRDIGGCAHDLDESGSRGARMMAESVRAATYLASTEHIFLVDGEPVISCWGHTILADSARPSVLPNLSALIHAPPPLPPLAESTVKEPLDVVETCFSPLRWILGTVPVLLLLLLALAWWRGWIVVPIGAPNGEVTAPGEPLEIPETAPEQGDMAFLEGNWRSINDLISTTTGTPVVVEYELDGTAGGLSWVIEPDQQCEAPVETFFEGETLVIQQSAPARCPNGSRYTQTKMICRMVPDAPAQCVAEQEGVEAIDVQMLKG